MSVKVEAEEKIVDVDSFEAAVRALEELRVVVREALQALGDQR